MYECVSAKWSSGRAQHARSWCLRGVARRGVAARAAAVARGGRRAAARAPRARQPVHRATRLGTGALPAEGMVSLVSFCSTLLIQIQLSRPESLFQ